MQKMNVAAGRVLPFRTGVHAMQSVNLSANYFELFDLPVNFELDKVVLTERYRALQHVVHPDRFASATDREKRLSVQKSAYINEALQTLKHPLKRAKYMLELKDIDMSTETSIQMDQEFLIEQIELREEISVIKSSQNPTQSLLTVNSHIEQSIGKLIKELTRLFASNDKDTLEKASDCVRRLQFFEKIQEEVETLEEQLLH